MPVKDQSFVANCDAAIRSASCGDIIANNTPAACK
jgi:hypothetical protein